MESYRRLARDSIELVKANEIIQKLNAKISKQEDAIELLKQKNREKDTKINMSHLSSVCIMVFYAKIIELSH